MFLGIFSNHLSFAQSLDEKKMIQEGNVYYLQEDFDKARTSYENVIAIRPSSLKGNYNLGNALYELKKYNEAITHYQKASKLAQNHQDRADIFHNLGNALMQSKQYQKAIEAYKDALRNNPSDNKTRYNLALAKKLLNNKNNKQNPPDLPKPSAYAKEMKAKADQMSEKGKFEQAYKTMHSALDKDSTVLHYQGYMDKLNEVIILDTIKIK